MHPSHTLYLLRGKSQQLQATTNMTDMLAHMHFRFCYIYVIVVVLSINTEQVEEGLRKEA